MGRSLSRLGATRSLLLCAGLSLAAITCDAASNSPGERDPGGAAIETVSKAGHYRVGLRPQTASSPSGVLHAWVVHVEQADGRLFAPTRLVVDGGMPQHGHGFQTAPRVTRALGGGDFLVEGIKFHMPGEWTFRVEVVGPLGGDVAQIRVQVEP